MKISRLYAVFVLLLLFGFKSESDKIQFKSANISDVSGSYPNMTQKEKEVFTTINQYRISKGLAPLKWISRIATTAEKHSSDMALRKTGFGHEGFEKRFELLKNKLGKLIAGAENVAYGNVSTQEIIQDWINSPDHKHNIEGDYNCTGIGVARSKDGLIFYTQIFVKQ
jgi:uncharacterized protein YkwD